MKYCFYYDESEHSRVINLSTVTGETHIMMVFWQLLSGGAAITKQLLNSVIMLLKKNTLIGRKKES